MFFSFSPPETSEERLDRYRQSVKIYRTFSEVARLDLNRRLDRLNLLTHDINLQRDIISGAEFELKRSNRRMITYPIAMIFILSSFWLLEFFDIWTPYNGYGYVFAGVTLLITISNSYIHSKTETDWHRSKLKLSSLRNEWYICCGAGIYKEEYDLLNEELYAPLDDKAENQYYEKQDDLKIRTLESLIELVGNNAGYDLSDIK